MAANFSIKTKDKAKKEEKNNGKDITKIINNCKLNSNRFLRLFYEVESNFLSLEI